MKKLTVSMAAKELLQLTNSKLQGTENFFLKERITQFVTAVDDAITDLQTQIEALKQAQSGHPK